LPHRVTHHPSNVQPITTSMRLKLALPIVSILSSPQIYPTNSFVVSGTCAASTSVPSPSILLFSSVFFNPLTRKAIFTKAMGTSSEGGECNTTQSIPPLYQVDTKYPGTAVQRLQSVHNRVAQLVSDNALQNKPWTEIRRALLWAGGLKDLPHAIPGQGYTGHSFNDFNHVDLTTMNDDNSENLHDGSVQGIAVGNRLGPGIKIASIPELGPGGSWSTCAMGCHTDPPNDVAHIQFRSRIAFKLVWVPNENYDTFVLVDDDGKLLAVGRPEDDGTLPSRREREMNWDIVRGGKYATVAKEMAAKSTNK